MDFYVFVTYVPQYGEDAFARSKNKFLVVLKKNKNTGIDPVSSFILRHHQFELACVVWWCAHTTHKIPRTTTDDGLGNEN
jgi:hypothetical protein